MTMSRIHVSSVLTLPLLLVWPMAADCGEVICHYDWGFTPLGEVSYCLPDLGAPDPAYSWAEVSFGLALYQPKPYASWSMGECNGPWIFFIPLSLGSSTLRTMGCFVMSRRNAALDWLRIEVFVDVTAPTCGIEINDGGAYTTSPAVTLHLSPTDEESGFAAPGPSHTWFGSPDRTPPRYSALPQLLSRFRAYP